MSENAQASEIRVGYQGVKGSYSHQASEGFFPACFYRGYRSFQEAIAAVGAGDVDYAVIPVENSTAGRVFEVYNLLPESNVHIVGEYLLPIHHCLLLPKRSFRGMPPEGLDADGIMAWKSSPLSAEEKAQAYQTIREVHSHPQALAQCRKYLAARAPKAVMREVYDTAGSARDIANREDAQMAAIASRTAADIFDMLILDENVEDVQNNTTRFLILTATPLDPETIADPALTTLLFETSHVPGALFKALNVFERHSINMTKLETYMSGPARPNPTFYVDVGANLMAARNAHVLADFQQHTKNVRIMGSYPASDRRGHDNSFLPVA